jgi:hypothetical protein
VLQACHCCKQEMPFFVYAQAIILESNVMSPTLPEAKKKLFLQTNLSY